MTAERLAICVCCRGTGEIPLYVGVHPNDPDGRPVTCPVCDGEGQAHPAENITLREYQKRHDVLWNQED